MDKWVVRKRETADTLIAAMTAGTCRTNEDVKRIVARHGDSVRWLRERRERENEAAV